MSGAAQTDLVEVAGDHPRQQERSGSWRLGQHCVPLDGIRGLAVLLVLLYDCLKLSPAADPVTFAARKLASHGWVGVDLFFVLSGYLITGVLLDTRGRPGYWSSFFLRRSVRIFPLYYVTLFAVFCVVPFGLWMLNVPSAVAAPWFANRTDHAWYWLYAQNWLFAWQQGWPDPIPIKHFWSLAIEEQFYLFWPFVVASLTMRKLGTFCVMLCLTSVVLRTVLMMQGVSPMVVFVMTITRLDGLCMGGLIAILMRTPVWRNRLAEWSPRLAIASLTGLVVVDQIWPILRSETFAAYSVGHLCLAISFGLLIAAAQTVPPNSLFARSLSVSPLVTLGKYSYAIYVFHKFVYWGLTSLNWSAVPEAIRGWSIFGCTVAVTLLVAISSWWALERPCLSLKKYFPRPDDAELVRHVHRPESLNAAVAAR